MNREIKFRIGNKTIWEVIYGALVQNLQKKSYSLEYSPNCFIDIDSSWTLMQFTGLKDKNGVEIYEGDVVKYLYAHFSQENEEDNYILSPIIFKDGQFYPEAGFEWNAEWTWQCEVRGNIYENPELIEGK